MTLGDSQSGLGYPEKAIVLFTKARATFTDQLGPEHLDTLASMNNLAEATSSRVGSRIREYTSRGTR